MTAPLVFDGSTLGGPRPTGVERGFLRTLRAFAKRQQDPITLFVPSDVHPEILAATRGEPNADRDLAIPAAVSIVTMPRIPLAVWRSTMLPRALVTLGARALWTPTTALPRSAPCATIATVHEIPATHPDAEDSRVRGLRQRRARLALRRRATRVVVPSQRTADDLLREIPALEPRTHVVPQPLDDALLRAALVRTEDRRGFVFLGRAMRRKNLPRIRDAWQRLPAAVRREHPFTWIGARDTDLAHAAPDWRILPAPTTRDLAHALRASRALVFASKSEGFGMPALEALACGSIPLVAKDSPPSDLCGALAVTCSPYDVASIEAAMRRATSDVQLAERVEREGHTVASGFTAQRSAEAWEHVLSGAVSSHRGMEASTT